MEGAGSLTLKRLPMQTGAVPHMTFQPVAREAGGQPSDQRIPLLLGQNTGSSDGAASAVPTNQAGLIPLPAAQRQHPIDNHQLGLGTSRCRARSMAISVAGRIPSRSISAALAWPIDQAKALARIIGTRASRREALSFLLS